jgi:phage protein D
MTLLGVRVTLLIGPTVAVPVPPNVIQALRRVEVCHKDEGQSGFEIVFDVGRSGPADALDYALLANPLLAPFNRVIVIVTFNVMPRVLMDGIIARQEFSPGQQPGQATLTIKGEDVSVMMDRTERSAEHPAQDETIIANKIIATYARYGLIPMVIPPIAIDPPIPIERIPVQQGTDLEFLRSLAARHGYVFYVSPGPAPFTNTAYWGPPLRGVPQHAITVNMGPETNATIAEAREDGLAPVQVEGSVQDRSTNAAVPVRTFGSLRPPLAAQPTWLVNMANARVRQFRATGLTASQAMGRAQGATDASVDTVRVTGELDSGRYGGFLESRALVGVRGAGYMNDGFYYVKKVTHKIEPGKYSQAFELTREGRGSTTPAVIP